MQSLISQEDGARNVVAGKFMCMTRTASIKAGRPAMPQPPGGLGPKCPSGSLVDRRLSGGDTKTREPRNDHG